MSPQVSITSWRCVCAPVIRGWTVDALWAVPDPIIEARAAEGHVTVFWGGDDLIGRMKELAKTQTIHRPPTAERIAQEVELIQSGIGHPAGAPGPASAPANADAVVELPGGRLVVHVLKDALAAEMFLRMTYSALIDADSLDTESHQQAVARPRDRHVGSL